MKRVETIHINGIVFSIDDNAFGKLSAYLDALGKYFEHEQGGREIIADIEARIAELFAERDGNAGQVVTIADVTKVIETLGTPEDIAGADADHESAEDDDAPPRAQQRPPQQPQKPPRRLFRDPDRRYLAGVCSGVAAWLGTTAQAVRAVFIVATMFYGASILAYFIFWILVPKAKTTAQKLEMRGEPVNINNIMKDVKESFNDPTLQQSFRDFLNEAGEVTGKTFGVFGRIIAALLGIFLFCWGIAFAIGLISLLFMPNIVFNHWAEWDFLSFTELFRHIITPSSYIIIMICAITAAVLTISAFLFTGVKLISGSYKVKHKFVHVALTIIWLAAIVTGIVTCIEQSSYFWSNERITETRHLAPSDTFYLAKTSSKLEISNNPLEIYFDKDNRCFYGKPNFDVRKSEDGQAKLTIRRESQGESKRAAYQYAENINYAVETGEGQLTFDPYFTVVPHDKWKYQTLHATLYVPEGTVIIFNKPMFPERVHRMGLRWRWNEEYTWVMTEKRGLQRGG